MRRGSGDGCYYVFYGFLGLFILMIVLSAAHTPEQAVFIVLWIAVALAIITMVFSKK